MTKFPAQVNWVNISEVAGINSVPAAEVSSSKLLRNVRGIIFDFDGTLFDHKLIAFYMIAAYPLDALRIWKERLIRKRFAGRDYTSPGDYYRAFFGALGKLCHRAPEKMRDWYFNQYMPRMVKVLGRRYALRHGAMELFRRLDENAAINLPGGNAGGMMKIAVYSDYPFLKERMEALGVISGPGVLLYSPESFGAQKPAVRPFLQIAKDFGIAPEDVLVVGDREDTDGLGAFNAGMRFFCLETGRKRYFRLDPNRSPIREEPHGPSLVMYAGVWDDLIKLLLDR